MDAIDELVRRNREFAEERGFRPLASARPVMRCIVLTCMDARINTSEVLGLEEGDVHVLRNAGATLSEDMIRSIVVSQFALGTEDIMLIRHADCGLRTPKKGELRSEVAAKAGELPPFLMGTFIDIDEAVRKDVEALRENRFLHCKDRIRGFVYEEDSGLLREVT